MFDDSANILQNKKLFLNDLSWNSLTGAGLSGDAGPMGRPVSMVTFALNIYFTGTDPFYFKLTNIVIHIFNTFLVGWLALSLLQHEWKTEKLMQSRAPYAALMTAAVWGVHPIGLTSVLYVVQRMTSLSTFFGLLALSIYAWVRVDDKRARDFYCLAVSACLVIFSLVMSALCKETGLLFIPLLVFIEFCVYRFELNGNAIFIGRWKLINITAIITLILLVCAILFIIPKMVAPPVFLSRGFTLGERVMTESRIIFLYLGLIFLPRLSAFNLYHDDIVLSQSFFFPISTALSIIGLLLITIFSIVFRRKYPLIFFSWGWFLISHSLESTIFPLELAHEHRNYFATFGFSLLFSYFVFSSIRVRRTIAIASIVVFIVVSGFITFNRSAIWSNLVDQAYFEAYNNPNSDRANYELGRVYLKLLDATGNVKYSELARKSFEKAMDAPLHSNGAYFALIHLAYFNQNEPDPNIIKTLRDRLAHDPLGNNNVSFIQGLMDCQLKNFCHLPEQVFVGLVAAAAENPTATMSVKGSIYLLLGRYFFERYGDFAKAEEFFKDAIDFGENIQGRIMLSKIYRSEGRFCDAKRQIDDVHRISPISRYDPDVRSESQKNFANKNGCRIE